MKITLEIPSEKIADLMVTAIEDNAMVRAWCNGVFLVEPKSYGSAVDVNDQRPWYAKKEIYEKSFTICVQEILDESLAAEGKNIKKHNCTSVQMAEAFRLMAEKECRHFGDFMIDNYDIFTADVFLQLMALGEVVYG